MSFSLKKLTVLLIVIVLICIVILFSFADVFYSVRLVNAIRNNDFTNVETIIQANPKCINILPSLTPKWWRAIIGVRANLPLNEACLLNNRRIIELLIQNGADVNGNDGRTALSIVYRNKKDGWFDLSGYLIQQGASLDYETDLTGEGPAVLLDILMPTSLCDDATEVVAAFTYAMDHSNLTDADWETVFIRSIWFDRTVIVTELLTKGICDVNQPYGSDLTTPLMFAARDSTPEMVQVLITFGADVSATDIHGRTALDYATAYGNDAVLDSKLLE